ncbi:hypothetical protein HDV00_011263 [Rhizophlyctis rosea]|nr:hypothetical protein HDV00_011263 [Rhizophlyctis rosea]
MKAAVLTPPSKTPALQTVVTPTLPSQNHILIKVHSTALTRDEQSWPELTTTRTGTPRPQPIIAGFDVSGVVVDVGSEVTTLNVGDKVFGLLDPYENGALAEYCVAREGDVAVVPEVLEGELEVVASILIPALTAWQALFEHTNLQAGDVVTLAGASGAVGMWTVLLAKWAGYKVIGSASPKNAEWVRSLGADLVVGHGELADAVHQFTNGIGTDLLLNVSFGNNLPTLFPVIKPGGTFITVQTNHFNHKSPDPSVRSLWFIVQSSGKQLEVIGKLIGREVGLSFVRASVYSRVYGLDEVEEAYRELERPGRGNGRIVVRVEGGAQ